MGHTHGGYLQVAATPPYIEIKIMMPSNVLCDLPFS